MDEIQITPTLQSKRELDTMLRSVTRDLTKVREFVDKEKNNLYKIELTKILTATIQFADRYDGCSKEMMETIGFKKDALNVFRMIAGQRRGGRKILFVMLSSPTSGLDQHYCSWWCTIRGLDGASVRLMESYLKQLSLEIAAEVNVDDTTTPVTEGVNSDKLIRKRIESDVLKTIREKVGPIEKVDGYSITTTGDNNDFTINVTILANNDDSGVADTEMKNDAEVKPELPVPVVGHFVPKSEAGRNKERLRNTKKKR